MKDPRPDQRTIHKAIDTDIVTINAIDFEAIGRDLHRIIAATTGTLHPRPWETPVESTPDGYPASASGSDPGGGGHVTTNTTSVENAAERRRRHRDPVGKLIAAAVDHLATAASHARAIQATLDRIVATQTVDNTTSVTLAAGCWALARVGGWEPVHSTIIIDGQPYALGRWAYDYHRRMGTIPTLAQCRAHVEGRRVYVKAS